VKYCFLLQQKQVAVITGKYLDDDNFYEPGFAPCGSCCCVALLYILFFMEHLLTGAVISNAYSNNSPMIKQLKCATPTVWQGHSATGFHSSTLPAGRQVQPGSYK